MTEVVLVVAGFGSVLAVALIGIWKTGQLRDLFNSVPKIDAQLEKLSDKLDELSKKFLG